MRADAGRIPGLSVHESDHRVEWMSTPWADVARAGDWLLELAAEVAPDVVHLNGYCHAALPWARPVLAVGHSCVLSWWRAVHGAEAPAAWNTYRTAVGYGLRAATRVAAPTAAMLASLAADYGPLPPAEVVPHGRVANGRFHVAASGKEPFVLAAGRLWDEAKNLALLDRVAPRLAWPVVVAGDLAHPASAAQPPRHVRTLGQLATAELAALMGRAAIYALPARYEPFGLSALEAALSGCALVLGDIPTLREVWGDAADLVPPDDAEALVAAVGRLIADPALRARRAAAAHARARTYTPERMAAGYLALYQHLVEHDSDLLSWGVHHPQRW